MANYINTETMQHPLSEADIRSLYPQTSFPSPFVPPEQFALVFPAPQPAYDSVTQVVSEVVPELTALGHWEQRWSVVPKFTEYTDDLEVLHTVVEQLATQAEATRVAAVPSKVSMRQARLALLQNGLLDTVNTNVGQLSPEAQIEWEYAIEVQKADDLVLSMKALLNWTDVQLDDLFTLANTK